MDDSKFIEIQRLFEIVHQRGLRELSLARPDFSIAISTVPTAVAAVEVTHPPAVHYAPVAMPVHRPAAEEKAPEPQGYEITSPLVGSFYRASSPDSEPFVEIGDEVEAGQTVCIVEAMKVFNEITTDHAGTVIAIPAKNGQLVQVGQPLVVLDILS